MGVPRTTGVGKSVVEPRTLNHRHYAVMREVIAGTPMNRIAKIFGYNPQRLSVIVNCSRFKDEMVRLRGEVESRFAEAEGGRQNNVERARKIIDGEVVNSINKLVELRDAEEPEIQLRSSLAILDRAGLSKIDKIQFTGQVEVNENLAFALAIGMKDKKDGS